MLRRRNHASFRMDVLIFSQNAKSPLQQITAAHLQMRATLERSELHISNHPGKLTAGTPKSWRFGSDAFPFSKRGDF